MSKFFTYSSTISTSLTHTVVKQNLQVNKESKVLNNYNFDTSWVLFYFINLRSTIGKTISHDMFAAVGRKIMERYLLIDLDVNLVPLSVVANHSRVLP